MDRRAHRHPRAPHRPRTTRRPPTWRSKRPSGRSRWPGPEPKSSTASSSARSRRTCRSRPRAAFAAAQAGREERRSPSTSRAACAGSLYGDVHRRRVRRAGTAKRVLVVGAELLTRIIDWQDRNTCVLFGDAAGAMVLGPSDDPNRGILSTHLAPTARRPTSSASKAGGSRYPITPRAARGEAAQGLDERPRGLQVRGPRAHRGAASAALEHERTDASGDVTHVIAHQANIRIIDAVLGARSEVPQEKCWLNIDGTATRRRRRCRRRWTRRTAPASSRRAT